MSLQPSVGGGSSPRKGKCCTQRTPVLTGAAPCTSVYWAGGLGTRSLSVILPPGVGNDQLGHRVGTEDRLGGREVELGQVEVGAPGVQAHKEVVAVEAHPAARFGYEVLLAAAMRQAARCSGVRVPQRPADSARLLRWSCCSRVRGLRGAHVLARDLAVTAVDIDDGALPARLWNGADFHIVSSTRF
jgi:hypothetical protein